MSDNTFLMKFIISAIIAIVVVSLGVGFFFAGSPSQARQERFDEQKLSDLSTLTYNIQYYWQAHKKLPDTLEEAQAGSGYGGIPIDPVSKEAYAYRKIDEQRFELCATFALSDTNANARFYGPNPMKPFDDWSHAAGYVCFERKIDPVTP